MNHIVYLSSDEEDYKRVDYSDWLDGVLETSDEKPKRKSNLSDPTVEDDDCVVLDGDPYKTTAKETAIDTCETDEVLVVGEKGEIACRDYPHPRHACAKYPFKSTLPQNYCEMCHCYVCDTRAPCAYWFMGFSNVDHCHANDKELLWKNQRQCIRTEKLQPVSKPAPIIPQLQRVSHPQSIPLPQNSFSPVKQFGIRACSASTGVATHPNTYIRPGYRAEQPRTFPQNPGLQPRGGQLYQNHRGGSYNGNPSPQVVPSNPFAWTRKPSGGVILPENGMHNIAQGSQYTCYTPPAASQGNPQRIVTGYISTVPESHSKVYARHFSRNMYSGNVQTSAVPSEAPNPPANQQQQQQSGRSNDKVLSEFEDWLMDTSNLTGPVCPSSGQDSFPFDFETFLE